MGNTCRLIPNNKVDLLRFANRRLDGRFSQEKELSKTLSRHVVLNDISILSFYHARLIVEYIVGWELVYGRIICKIEEITPFDNKHNVIRGVPSSLTAFG